MRIKGFMLLKPHKIIHGEALDVMAKWSDNSFQAIITDPPYDLTKAEMEEYLLQFRRLAKGTIIIFAAPENQWPTSDQYLFWTKPISTKNTSRKYSRFVEVIHLYSEDKAVWNCKRHWSNYVNIFTDIIEEKIEHPYQKPIALLERLIRNHTSEGDWILDPFCGSGTTVKAAVRHNRNCIGIEKDATYAALADK